MPGSVIVGGARTPIGKLSGSLKDIPAVDLGGIAISAALQKAGITGDEVEYVIMGQVIQAGTGQITARRPQSRAASP
jgi:acetyl-CoA C-acetyltransferase